MKKTRVTYRYISSVKGLGHSDGRFLRVIFRN